MPLRFTIAFVAMTTVASRVSAQDTQRPAILALGASVGAESIEEQRDGFSGVAIEAGLRFTPPDATNGSVLVLLSYMPGTDQRPAVLETGGRLALRPLNEPEGSLLVLFGAGALHYGADPLAGIAQECSMTVGCFFEASVYQAGWKAFLALGVGSEIPFGNVDIEFRVQYLKPFGRSGGGTRENARLLRLSLGASYHLL